MKSSKYYRRKFFSVLTASTAGGVLINAASPSSTANAQTSPLLSGQQSQSEYLFADGITYLNTRTLGPCRRDDRRISQQMGRIRDITGQVLREIRGRIIS